MGLMDRLAKFAGDAGALARGDGTNALAKKGNTGNPLAKKPKEKSELAIILDASGSMKVIWDYVKKGYERILSQAGDSLVTVVLFSDTNDTNILANGVPARRARFKWPHTGDWTALYDAIGRGITAVCERRSSEPGWNGRFDGVSVVIITDGDDNNSVEYTAEDIRELIAAVRADGMRVYIVATNAQDAYRIGDMLGVPYDYLVNFSPNREGAESAWTAIAKVANTPQSESTELAIAPADWKSGVV